MKELTIEQKAQRYDEALEKARQLCVYPTTKPFISDLQDLFPELKESEGERIRKEIIKYFKKYQALSVGDYNVQDILAWLEKQGETFTKKDVDDAELKKIEQKQHLELKAGKWYICHRAYCCRADNLTVREGERFMCEKDGVVKGFVIKEPEKYFKEVCAPAPLEDECNLLWSEEDESNRIIIEGELLNSKRYSSTYDYATYDKLISWVNSIKDRVQPQPKQEWSEEDESRLDIIFERIERGLIVDKDDIDRLKSLKDRYIWKPSDEQMGALNYVVNLMASSERPTENDLYYNILKSLRQQLMKLKG